MYSSAKKAWGICNRCGFRYRLSQLRREMSHGSPSGARVCPDCYDSDHPQNWTDMLDVTDAQSLQDPRPDLGIEVARRLSAWDPIGSQTTSTIKITTGRLVVTT